jgi:hypothetical protein
MMENKSHMIEIMQKTRIELENGDITDEEKDEAIRVRMLQYELGSEQSIVHVILLRDDTHSCMLLDSLHSLFHLCIIGLSISSDSDGMHDWWSRQCLVESMGMAIG